MSPQRWGLFSARRSPCASMGVHGDTDTRREGDTADPPEGDTATRRQGDTAVDRHTEGDRDTRTEGDTAVETASETWHYTRRQGDTAVLLVVVLRDRVRVVLALLACHSVYLLCPGRNLEQPNQASGQLPADRHLLLARRVHGHLDGLELGPDVLRHLAVCPEAELYWVRVVHRQHRHRYHRIVLGIRRLRLVE